MPIALILEILQAALAGLAASGKSTVAVDSAIISSFVTIVQKAQAAFQAANGSPLDLSKLPIESKVP